MSANVECSVAVSKVVETETDERSIIVTMKGVKTVVHDRCGWDIEDIAEITLTIKCVHRDTVEELGIDEFMNRKVFILRDIYL